MTRSVGDAPHGERRNTAGVLALRAPPPGTPGVGLRPSGVPTSWIGVDRVARSTLRVTALRRGRESNKGLELLAYLAELDERRLFLDLGFPSLFAFCVESLGLSEATAGRYIAVARVCQAHPEAFALVARGELHASALSLMKQFLTRENAVELFALCARKSARQVELLLVARFPKPDVRDSIRRLPNPPSPTLNVDSTAQPVCPERGVAPAASMASAVSAAPTGPAALGGRPCRAHHCPEPKKPARIEPLSTDRYGVHLTADGEFRELLERVRGLAGHRLPSGDLLTLMKRGLEAYERDLVKDRFAVGGKARGKRMANAASAHASSEHECPANAPPAPSRPRKRRLAAAAIRRVVFARDGGRCTFVSADGQRCEARRFLEIDHIQPFAKGGADSIENLRLLCNAHNLHAARSSFGRTYLRYAIGRKRDRTLSRGFDWVATPHRPAQSRAASSSTRFMSSSSSVR